MARRYKLQDVYNYVLEYHSLDWQGFKIHDKGKVRSARLNDYRGDKLNVIAIMMKGQVRNTIVISVDNNNLLLSGIKPSKVSWKKYLDSIRYLNQNLTNEQIKDKKEIKEENENMSSSKLDNIQEVLEENLDMKWEERIVYDHHTKTYRQASEFLDFGKNRSTYVRMTDNKKQGHVAKVKLNDKQFVIEIEGMKIDVSDHWIELSQPELIVTSIK